MMRVPILIALLASTSVYAVDYDVFLNCSRSSFCSSFRYQNLEPASQFSADLENIRDVNNVAIIPLINANNDKLNLQIALTDDGPVRIKVLEEDHSRYEIIDVLDGEPEAIPFSATINEGRLSISKADSCIPAFEIVTTQGPPFTVEVYLLGELIVVLNGNRLVMENKDDSKAFSFGVEFEGASKLYGLFDHAYNIALGETAGSPSDPFRLKNTDNWGYDANSVMAMYGSVPVIYGHSASSTSGVFIHNAAQMFVDISYSGSRPSAYFMVEGGTFDMFILPGPSPKEVVRQFTGLTGTAHLPQLWALGYHQNRYTYWTQEEVKDVVATMDNHDFPLDVIWLDDGHSNGNRYFEWNPENFTDPVEMQRNVSATGRVMIPVSDPHIKVADDYAVYAGAKDKFLVQTPEGTNFEAVSWPGVSSWIDYLNPEARDYYGEWFGYDKFVGTTEAIGGYWNDMNEPSIFDDSIERTFPPNLVHYGGVLNRDIHNMYGLLHTKATHAGLMKRDNGTKRPFILSRSHFAGSQRYAAMWTGDNISDWPFLRNSYSQCLTANLLGMVFCGADVGGFFSNPTDEIFQRWYQAAIWLPFFRAHSNKGTVQREPYLFSDEIQGVLRNAIKMRYKHLPVWYTLFFEHTISGDPLIRPLLYDYPEYLEYDTQLLLGSDIMAAPVMEPSAEKISVTFPGDGTYWYRADDDSRTVYTGPSVEDVEVDINTSPFFYRGGSIIARKDIERPCSARMADDSHTLYINVDAKNTAKGNAYIDDYTSFAYLENNSYLYLQFSFEPDTMGINFRNLGTNSEAFNFTIERVVISEFAGTNKAKRTTYTTTADGKPLQTIDINKELGTRSNNFTLYL